MKRTFIITLSLLLSLMMCTANAKVKEINTPYWKYSETGNFIIKRILFTDTATVLFVKLQLYNGSWSLASQLHLESNGKIYKMRSYRCFETPKGGIIKPISFTFDSVFYKDVNDSLILCFEPLPKKSKTFDFIETESSNWNVYGIRTVGEPYPFSLSQKRTNNTNVSIPVYNAHEGKAVIKGHIYGYDKHMAKSFGYYGYKNPITKKYDRDYKIDSIGNYYMTFEAFYPIHPVMMFPGKNYNVTLVPGDTLVLDVDATALLANTFKDNNFPNKKQAPISYLFSGQPAGLNETLNKMASEPIYIDSMIRDTDITLKFYTERIWNKLQQHLKEINEDQSLNQQQREILSLAYQKKYVGNRCSFVNYMGGVYYYKTKNDSIANAKVKEYGKTFTLKDEHSKDLTLFSNPKAFYILDDYAYLPYMEANGFNHGEIYNWMIDLRKAEDLAGYISSMHIIKDEATWDTIDPIYVPTLKDMNDTMIVFLKRMKDNNSSIHVCKYDSINPSNALSDIVSRYKGNVIFVDCWATWCGPCCRGIKGTEPMKESFVGKDVKFIYLTNESSPMQEWIDMIKQIPGEQYRLSNNQWKTIPTIGAIPHYFIFDRNDDKILDQVGWSDNLVSVFSKTINDTLAK